MPSPPTPFGTVTEPTDTRDPSGLTTALVDNPGHTGLHVEVAAVPYVAASVGAASVGMLPKSGQGFVVVTATPESVPLAALERDNLSPTATIQQVAT